MALFLIFVSHPVSIPLISFLQLSSSLPQNVLNTWLFWRRNKSTPPNRLQSPIHRNGSVVLPALGFNGTTIVSDAASANTQKESSLREYYESKVNGRGVEIIGKPEEAFTREQLRMSTATTMELSQNPECVGGQFLPLNYTGSEMR